MHLISELNVILVNDWLTATAITTHCLQMLVTVQPLYRYAVRVCEFIEAYLREKVTLKVMSAFSPHF